MSGADCPGCLILLIDESVAMESLCQDGKANVIGNQPKRKSDAVAATLNTLIRQLTAGPNFDIALVGYHTDADGNAVAKPCWGGELAGRDFVSLKEAAAHPVKVEQRARKLPDPTSITGFREEMVDFPVWYTPQIKGTAPQIKAFEYSQGLLTAWQAAQHGPYRTPIILHLFAGGSSDGNPFKVISNIQKLPSNPLVIQAHLCVSEHVPATLYAASRVFVPAGPARDLFDRCSPLPANLISFLKAAKVAVGPNARGMVYNGRMTDIVQFMSLTKEFTRDWPAKSDVSAAAPEAPAPVDTPAPTITPAPVSAAPDLAPIEIYDVVSETEESLDLNLRPTEQAPAPTEKAACVLFMLDRSVADPFGGNTQSSWTRLQDHVNSLLAKIAKAADGQVETGVISYGTDPLGTVEVRQTFEGPLSGKTLVSHTELADGALRIDEVQQQEPDGVGGLMTITLKKKIYVELEPTTAAPPVSAFEAAQGLMTDWCDRHPGACVAPILVHLTRGQLSAEELGEAWDKLSSIRTLTGGVVGYHLVATEEPHSSVAFPVDNSGLQTDQLKALFDKSSTLLASERLEVSKPKLIKIDSRGLVVNGKFDFLMDGITEAFSKL
ncbi:MAG: hypothetical protein JWM11_3538 [Planctomycetaceae bacterium]|nr:hypothetical protein [Planctomycetaceae bacterium]